MSRRFRRLTLYILVIIAIPPLLLDALLWHVDPYGTRIMVYNWIALAEVDTQHPTGYQYPQGTYDLGFYTVTIVDDGKRFVPASGSGDCVIAFVGDSVTWGHGVNDADTFVNQLAIHFPNVTIWNTARNRYSVTNVAAVLDHYPADGYIWTMISNDAGGLAEPQTYTRKPSATELYITTLVAEKRFQQQLNSLTWGAYAPLAQAIMQRPDVLTFGFDDNPLTDEAKAWGVIPIPYPVEVVSIADKHPSAQGHQQIADVMLSHVTEFIAQVCHG